MADTTFISHVTKVQADWAQDVNDHTYRDPSGAHPQYLSKSDNLASVASRQTAINNLLACTTNDQGKAVVVDSNGNAVLAVINLSGNVDWANILNKPTFAAVATSGSYVDLTNKPTFSTTLAALTDIDSTGTWAVDGNILSYNSAQSKWLSVTLDRSYIKGGGSNTTQISIVDLGGGNDAINTSLNGTQIQHQTKTSVQLGMDSSTHVTGLLANSYGISTVFAPSGKCISVGTVYTVDTNPANFMNSAVIMQIDPSTGATDWKQMYGVAWGDNFVGNIVVSDSTSSVYVAVSDMNGALTDRIVKYDSSGNLVWQKEITVGGHNVTITDLIEFSYNGVDYLAACGFYSGTTHTEGFYSIISTSGTIIGVQDLKVSSGSPVAQVDLWCNTIAVNVSNVGLNSLGIQVSGTASLVDSKNASARRPFIAQTAASITSGAITGVWSSANLSFMDAKYLNLPSDHFESIWTSGSSENVYGSASVPMYGSTTGDFDVVLVGRRKKYVGVGVSDVGCIFARPLVNSTSNIPVNAYYWIREFPAIGRIDSVASTSDKIGFVTLCRNIDFNGVVIAKFAQTTTGYTLDWASNLYDVASFPEVPNNSSINYRSVAANSSYIAICGDIQLPQQEMFTMFLPVTGSRF